MFLKGGTAEKGYSEKRFGEEETYIIVEFFFLVQFLQIVETKTIEAACTIVPAGRRFLFFPECKVCCVFFCLPDIDKDDHDVYSVEVFQCVGP